MKLKLFFFFFFLYSLNVKAQKCDCSINFRYLIEKIKKNYVGYSDKVNAETRPRFEKFTDSLQKIANQSNSYRCLSLSREWLSFFNDKHIIFGMDFEKLNSDSVRQFFSDEEKINLTEKEFKAYLNKKDLDSIEGIWHYDIYEVGIIRDLKKANEFVGFILKADSIRWMKQQIKFKLSKTGDQYQTIYFSGGDHSINYPILNKEKDTIDFGFFGKWQKGEKKIKKIISKQQNDQSPKFKIIDNQTSLFEFPSFGALSYVAQVDSLVKKNETVLKNTKHLIIDLRDNGGGSVYVYKSLIPYIYTNPILTEGGDVLATEDNIRDGYSTQYPEVSDSIQDVLTQNLIKLKAHQGELYNLYPVDTIKLETVLKNPEQVSFLVNRNTASAAELFILQAKQSKKVKIYGTNSAGAIDYTETVKSKMPCSLYTLFYPACKSSRLPNYPLDNIGIKPDIEISSQITDWIEFVIKNKEKY